MNRLKELRQRKNLTFKELSKKLQEDGIRISSDSLAKYERGDREPKIDKWQALANFFDVTVPYLQGIDDKPNTGYSKEYIYQQLDDAYKEPYTKDYEIEPPFTNPVLSAKEEIEKYSVIAFLLFLHLFTSNIIFYICRKVKKIINFCRNICYYVIKR